MKDREKVTGRGRGKKKKNKGRKRLMPPGK
jgi:hypothetical protein